MMKHVKGLLFYLSGATDTAEYANGRTTPTFSSQIDFTDGKNGGAIHCDGSQELAWRAPGNIYSHRGTLSYFWRAGYPVGPTEFPLFRISVADSSTWDQIWGRIDWAGDGIEALITDINLSRARVRYKMKPEELDPQAWYHFCISWDENWGLKLYINGQKAAEEYRPAQYAVPLDQFGPHQYIIGSWNVASDYNFTRGGDICELCIFDTMLSDAEIAGLARCEMPADAPAYEKTLADAAVRGGFDLRYGFDQPLPTIPQQAAIRKVEVHDAYDLKRWWFKGMDGIRETTWPGVYNRSRLKGRNDYFQIPDWDCYSQSGKAIVFHMPEGENFNHMQMSGSAHGVVELLDQNENVLGTLFRRESGERTGHFFQPLKDCRIRFTNDEIEEPMGDFSFFHVREGYAPEGIKRVGYSLRPGVPVSGEAEAELAKFVRGYYLPYERGMMTAVRGEAELQDAQDARFPVYNVIVPYEADDTLGLDGVEITLPAFAEDTDVSIQIRDPLWYHRNLTYFSFHCPAGESKKLWFDTRDRVLPEGKCLYVRMVFSASSVTKAVLTGTAVTLVYKSAADAKAEHTIDRFTQVRDIYGHIVEETPVSRELDLLNRYLADIADLRKVSPEHVQGQYYERHNKIHYMDCADNTGCRPACPAPPIPAEVSRWAFRQIEQLRYYKYIINWYIDNRMVENGEMGGGLSDDGDFIVQWVFLVQMGCDPEKIYRGMERNTDAFYDQGMMTNGLCSIKADELHSSEEGTIAMAACLMARPGDPKMLERAMETCRSLDWVTGINAAGHRHIRSMYYSASTLSLDPPYNRQRACGFSALIPCWMLSRFNNNPTVRQQLRELAESQLAHCKDEHDIPPATIEFDTDAEIEERLSVRSTNRGMMMAACYQLDMEACRQHLPEGQGWNACTALGFEPMPMTASGAVDKDRIADMYEELNYRAGCLQYYSTEGHPWIDRVYYDPTIVSCHRLADPSFTTVRANYPSNRICWSFADPCDDERVAILAPVAEWDKLKLIVCNISDQSVQARIIGNEIRTGLWQMRYGVDADGDDCIDGAVHTQTGPMEMTLGMDVTFAPKATTIIEMQLVEEREDSRLRYDLGLGRDDIRRYDHGLNVRIHSLGSRPTPECTVALMDQQGNILKSALLPPLPAPIDNWPRYRDVVFNLHNVPELVGLRVVIDPEGKLHEITRDNNSILLTEDIFEGQQFRR